MRHMLASTFFFGCMNVFIKLVGNLPAWEIVFFRCGVALLISGYILYRAGVRWAGENRLMLLARGTVGTIALYTFFLTLKHLPLGTAVTLQYLSPIFTTLFATLFLQERIRPVMWLCFLLSFLGVFVMKGWNGEISWTMLGIGVVSAAFSGVAYNIVRSLKGKEHPVVVVLHFQLIGMLAGAVGSIPVFSMPQGWEWLYLVLVGVFTHLGQYHLTHSLQMERVARVTILNYLGVLYALIFGFFLFREQIHLQQVAGILLVVSGVVLSIFIQNRSKAVNEQA